jgi:hypothetical protein
MTKYIYILNEQGRQTQKNKIYFGNRYQHQKRPQSFLEFKLILGHFTSKTSKIYQELILNERNVFSL